MGCASSTGLEEVVKPAAKTFRVAVMGPPMSGKSALVKRYLTQQGTEGYNADHQIHIGIKASHVDGLGMVFIELMVHPGRATVECTDAALNDVDGGVVVVDASAPFFEDSIDAPFNKLTQVLPSQVRSALHGTTGSPSAAAAAAGSGGGSTARMQDQRLQPVSGLPIALVVTHMDVVEANPIDFVRVQEAALEWGRLHGASVSFVSSKNNTGIHGAFAKLLKRLASASNGSSMA